MADDSPDEPIGRQLGERSENVVARGEGRDASVSVCVTCVVCRERREERNRTPVCVCVWGGGVILACYLASEKFGSSVRDR